MGLEIGWGWIRLEGVNFIFLGSLSEWAKIISLRLGFEVVCEAYGDGPGNWSGSGYGRYELELVGKELEQ